MITMLKRFFPYRRKGRPYQFFIESDGSTITLVKSDVEECMIEGKKLFYPHDFNVVDSKCDVHNVEYSGTQVIEFYPCDLSFTPSGASYVTLPDAKAFDYMTIYVWAVRR